MDDIFILTVDYNGNQKEYQARLLLQGYTHKFVVIIDNQEVYFERDEDGS